MIGKYLSIGNACNLKCKFCYNDSSRDEKTFFEKIEKVILDVSNIKKVHDNIVIVGGEPFSYPNILKVLAYVNKVQFKNVCIVTNGIRLSDIKFAIYLFYYGINSVEFSIHAHSVKLEEEITARPGKNLLKREDGIKNILLLNKKYSNKKIRLSSNTVINKLNYDNILNIIDYISGLGIKKLSLSFMYNLKGLSLENKSLFVKYSDVVDVFNQSNKTYDDLNLKIDWLPYCIHKKILKIKYEIREVERSKKLGIDYSFFDAKKQYKVKSKECSKCSVYGKLCNGVFKEYIDIFGEEEFKSI